MQLILLILRWLFGLHLDGSSRPLRVAARSDGRTESHLGGDWLWNWLRECADWLKLRFSAPRSRDRAGGVFRGIVRGSAAPPGTD